MKTQYVKNTVPVIKNNACPCFVNGKLDESFPVEYVDAGNIFKVFAVTCFDVILTSEDADVSVNPQIFMKFFKYVEE